MKTKKKKKKNVTDTPPPALASHLVPPSAHPTGRAGSVVRGGVQELEAERLGVGIPVLPAHAFAAVDLLGLNLERDGLIRLGRDLEANEQPGRVSDRRA